MPAGRAGEVQATLAVLINGTTPCDCIFISQAAVNAHHLPTAAGWYVEVPDQDVAFSVRFAVIAPPHRYPLIAQVYVDGHKAEGWQRNTSDEEVVSGVKVGTDEAGRKLVQPFTLRKTAFHEPNRDDDEGGAGLEADVSKRTAGTIALEVRQARLRPYAVSSPSSATRAAFTQRSVVPDKKASFGIERSVAVGATVVGPKFKQSRFDAGDLIDRLEVRYRTPRFFDTLQCRIDPQRGTKRRSEGPTATTVIDLLEEEEEEEKDSADGDEGDGNAERRTKKRIKREPSLPRPPAASATSLQNESGVDSFLCLLAEKEEMEMSMLKPLVVELAKQELTTVGQLRELTRERWREVMRGAGLPASLARSASQLSAPPSSSAAPVCLIIDD